MRQMGLSNSGCARALNEAPCEALCAAQRHAVTLSCWRIAQHARSRRRGTGPPMRQHEHHDVHHDAHQHDIVHQHVHQHVNQAPGCAP